MISRNVALIAGFAFLAGLFTGCGSWSSGTDFDNAVWSDDDTQVAYVKRTFKSKKELTHTKTKDFSIEVFVSDADGLNAKQVTGTLIGGVKDLFFMNDAGYLILGRGLEPTAANGNKVQTIIYEKIGLNGSVTKIAEATGNIAVSCDGYSSNATSPPLRVIPSRDGKTLAMVESTSDCNGNDMTVTFLNAATLNQIGSSMSVDTELLGEGFGPGGLGLSFLTMAWVPEGSFVVSKAFGADPLLIGWKFDVGAMEGEWVDSIVLDCLQVATSSTSTASNGTEVQVEDDGTLSFGTNMMFPGCY